MEKIAPLEGLSGRHALWKSSGHGRGMATLGLLNRKKVYQDLKRNLLFDRSYFREGRGEWDSITINRGTGMFTFFLQLVCQRLSDS